MGLDRGWFWLISSGWCFLASLSFAQPQKLTVDEVAHEFDQRTWGREHGLPDSRVWSILQGHDGYLWVGTGRGLGRFDGREFAVYDHLNTPELTNDICRALAEDSQGNLWIATRFGLVRKAGNRFTRFAHEPPLFEYPAICPSRRGGVWVVGRERIWRFQGAATDDWPKEESVPELRGGASIIEEEENGNLWIGSVDGLFRYDPNQARLELVRPDASLGRLPVIGMCRNGGDELWVLYAEKNVAPREPEPKVWLTCHKGSRWVKTPDNKDGDFRAGSFGRFLATGPPGVLWCPATESGVWRWSEGQFQFLPLLQGRTGDRVLCACSDREGNLWLGLDYGGLQRWTPRKVQTYSVQDGLVHDDAWSICEGRDGSVWVGTSGGVSQFKDGRFRNFPIPEERAESNVRAIAEDQAGRLWVGTMSAIRTLRDGQLTRLRLPGDWVESKVRVLHTGRDGALWIGTVRGLTRLQNGERAKYTMADGLAADEVRAILESKTGALWVGTLGGGLSLLQDGRFTTFNRAQGLSNDNVWALHEDGDGVLWIGTEKGLNRLKDGQVTTFTTSEGLPDNLINCILEDDFGRLWIGHDHGIYWIWKQQLNELASKKRARIEVVSYDETDGLLSIETNGQKSNPAGCKTRDGRLWFPTKKGVAVIDPTKVGPDEIAPIAVVEEIQSSGKLIFSNRPERASASPGYAVADEQKIRLPPGGARVLAFRYTGNTFVAPEKERFRYRLVGLDDHWIEASTRREAHFTELRPGDYRFELSACNHRGVWQRPSTAMAFNVAPFVYQTWWFELACGGALLALIVLTVRWRVLETRRIAQLERVNALNEQRKEIARDVHDELGASLTRIVQLSNEALKETAPPGQIGAVAERIATIAGEAVDSIGGIVWANDPDYDTLEDLIAYVREYAANFFADSPIQVRFEFPECVPSWPVTGFFRRNLVMLMKEALQNVSKHAQASHLTVRVALGEGLLEMCVVDNGRGFPSNGGDQSGNGLANMRQRVSELQGRCEISSTPGQGTTIRASVPLPGRSSSGRPPRGFSTSSD